MTTQPSFYPHPPPPISKHHIIPLLFSLISPPSMATVSLGCLEFSGLSYPPGGVRSLGEGKNRYLFIHHQHFLLSTYKKQDIPRKTYYHCKTDTSFILITSAICILSPFAAFQSPYTTFHCCLHFFLEFSPLILQFLLEINVFSD